MAEYWRTTCQCGVFWHQSMYREGMVVGQKKGMEAAYVSLDNHGAFNCFCGVMILAK